ncbi:Dynein heavy chain 1, axonemal [Homalodisca vitripennis]|nr:Dynein heavy chain 1, axonemal [Homalodisca vitripennis]
MLDQFWYALEQEEFEAKWEALGWPQRLTIKVEEVNNMLDEETEVFQKLQVDDEFMLHDRLELISVTIANLAAQSDFSKVHEIAVDVRRAWKLIKETQEFGQLLNSRQKLFGMPVTPFDQIRKLSNEFEPYKNLWTTASGNYLDLLTGYTTHNYSTLNNTMPLYRLILTETDLYIGANLPNNLPDNMKALVGKSFKKKLTPGYLKVLSIP